MNKFKIGDSIKITNPQPDMPMEYPRDEVFVINRIGEEDGKTILHCYLLKDEDGKNKYGLFVDEVSHEKNRETINAYFS